MGKRRRKRISCPNCSVHLKEEMNYCFNCGQENHIKRVSMKMLTGDFISTYFSADSKVLTTLKYLISKPSFLSLEYLNGKIEAYLKPIRLYVFISFVFFLLMNMTSSNNAADFLFTIEDGQEVSVVNTGEEIEPTDKVYIDGGNTDLNDKIEEIFSNKKELNLFYNYFISKFPILLFVIIPVLAAILFVFFYKKEYYYIDHLVFALHLQTFLFVMLTITTILNWIFTIDINEIAFVVLLIYGFIAAKKFYKRNYLSTFIRFVLTSFTHLIVGMIIFTSFFLLLVKVYSI